MALKQRVKRLEETTVVKEYGGIIVYFENEVDEEIDGKSKMLNVDYYLVNDNNGDPLTDEKMVTALKGKTYITYMPIEDKNAEYVEINAKKNSMIEEDLC